MQYDDFATADPANAPLDAPLLIGAQPFVWLAFLAVILAVAVIAWLMGQSRSTARGDAAQGIWDDIDEAAKAAMKADDNALKGRAERLLKVIRARLGHTLAFAGALPGVEALQDAVDGRRSSHGHGRDDHGHDDHGEDHDEHDGGAQDPAQPPASTGGAANITVITVGANASAGGSRPSHGARGLTQREQTDALRLAVAAFNQHWRDAHARVAEMDAVHAELSGGSSGAGRTGRAAPRLSGSRAGH